MNNFIKTGLERIDEANQIVAKNRVFIFSLIVLSILYVLPLILANTYYIDDMSRTVWGYGWNHDGRYISSGIMHLLSFQSDVVYSLYPYSMMISSIILTVSGFIVSYSLGVRQRIGLFFGSFLLTSCPFLLEIMTYRFDCIPISLSIFCIVLPFLFFNKKKVFFILSIIGLFLSFGLYQTTTLSYCIILCFFLIKEIWNEQYKRGSLSILWSVGAFVIAFFGYKISLNILDLESITDGGRAEFIFKDENFSSLIKERYYGLKGLVTPLITSSYRFVLYILIIFNLLSLVIYFRNHQKKIFNKQLFIKLILITAIIGFIAICTASVNMFVYEQRWVPRAMIGWGITAYLLFFPLLLSGRLSKYFVRLALVPFMFYSFLLSSQFGMYLKNQDEFSDYIINLMSPKLLEHGRLKVVVKGVNKTAYRNISVNHNTMPFIYKLAPIYERNSWYWGIVRLNKFDNISSEYVGGEERDKILENIEGYPIVDSNIYYSLRIKDGIAIIDFDKEE